jgi:exopolysaccharide biosynthesis polyprenyl glycosylphosphotransferase
MIRRHITALRLSLMAVDVATAVVVFLATSAFRYSGMDWRVAWSRLGIDPILLPLLYAAGWMSLLWLLGLYRLRARWSVRAEFLDIVRAGSFMAIATFSALFILKVPEVSRLFLITLFPTQVVVTLAFRLALRLAVRSARARGMNARYILIVGTGDTAEAFSRRIERRRELGLRVIGHVAWAPGRHGRPPNVSRPIVGDLNDLEQILHDRVVDEVGICLPPEAWGLVEPITRLCEDEGKIVRIPLIEGQLTLPGARQEEFDGIPVMSLVYGPDRVLGLIGKRVLDATLAAIAIVLLSPAFLAMAAWIFLEDGRPVLFRQDRVGLHGRIFKVVKFRTMVRDAEARLEDLLEQNEIQGQAFKLSVDPRLSRTGRWLRKTSLDELPQLWNVLKGEMSLVGPRPPLPREVADYDVWHRRRLSMKPGITGLWQVSARHEEEFDRWVEMDLDYIDRWSLWLDLKIMLRTIPAMLQGR